MPNKNRKYLFFSVGGCLFLLFVFFSYLVQKKLFVNLDFNTTVRLQDHISRYFDNFFSVLSYIGEVQIVSIFLILLLAINRKLKGVIILLLFGVFHLLEIYGKVFLSHKPPPEFMVRTNIPSNFPQFYISTANSYPSGHATRALFITTLAGVLFYKSKKISPKAKLVIFIALFIYDFSMLISRVYLGEHWISDVIGGSILGLSFGLIAAAFL